MASGSIVRAAMRKLDRMSMYAGGPRTDAEKAKYLRREIQRRVKKAAEDATS